MRESITLTLSGPSTRCTAMPGRGEKESGGGREGEREEGKSDGATSTAHTTITMSEFILKGFFENSFALHTAYIQYVWALS